MIKVTGEKALAAWCGLFKVKTKNGRELIGSFVPVGWLREMSDDLSKAEREDYFLEFQALTDDLDAQTLAFGRVTTYEPRTVSIMDMVEWRRVDLPTQRNNSEPNQETNTISDGKGEENEGKIFAR